MVFCEILNDIFLTCKYTYRFVYYNVYSASLIRAARWILTSYNVSCVCLSASYTRYGKNLIQFSSRLSAPRSKLMFAFHAALPLCCIRVQTRCMHASSHRLSAAPRCLRFHYIYIYTTLLTVLVF